MTNKNIVEFYKRREFWKEDPVLFFKEVLGEERIPYHQKKMIRAIAKNNRVSIRSANGIGKCKHEDDFVVLANGEIAKAKDLINKEFEILSYKDGKQLGKKAIAKDNGLKNCYKIRTTSGREITVTENHPLYLGKLDNNNVKEIGWTETQYIKSDDLVLVPKKHNCKTENTELSNEEIRDLAYYSVVNNLIPTEIAKYSDKNIILYLGYYFEAKGAYFDKEKQEQSIIISSKDIFSCFELLILRLGISYKVEFLNDHKVWKLKVHINKDQKWQNLNCPEGFKWEKVAECKCVGECPTVIISVEDTHTYLTTFYEHNSYIVSGIILWFFLCYIDPNPKVTTVCVFTAPTFNQVKTNIFNKIRSFVDLANKHIESKFGEGFTFIGELSKDQNKAEIRFRNEDYIQGVTASGENTTVGKHGSNVLLVYDEAQGVPQSIYSDFQGITKSGIVVKEIMIGNTTLPNGKIGRFYESFTDKSIFHQIKISAFDTPNFIEPNLKLEDFLCDPSEPNYWRKKLDAYCKTSYRKAQQEGNIAKWEIDVKLALPDGKHLINPIEVYNTLVECGMNPDSYEFLTRVLAEFPTESSSTLYPLSWIEQSFNNYDNEDYFEPGVITMGVDIASGLGKDNSTIAIKNGNKIVYLKAYDIGTTELLREIERVYYEFLPREIRIERDSLGKPIVDLSIEKGLPVVPIVSGGGPGTKIPFSEEEIKENEYLKQTFRTKRDEMCWTLRELLNPERTDNSKSILLPPDKDLKKAMVSFTYGRPNGKIQVIKKDILRRILKESPDCLDAINLASVRISESEIPITAKTIVITGH